MKQKYILLGAGGTGSIIFPSLLRYLENFHKTIKTEFSLVILDGKEVAISKLHRQLFFGRFAGSNKAEALAEQYDVDTNVVTAIPEYLGASNAGAIQDGDFILIAVDNFPVRSRIETRGLELDNITVINGGNEMYDGSMQIWIRRNGKNITPPMSQGHPELHRADEDDPSTLSCQQIAELPSGEQTIIANMMSATAMLAGLHKVHEWETNPDNEATDLEKLINPNLVEEVFFDLKTFSMRSVPRPGATL